MSGNLIVTLMAFLFVFPYTQHVTAKWWHLEVALLYIVLHSFMFVYHSSELEV